MNLQCTFPRFNTLISSNFKFRHSSSNSFSIRASVVPFTLQKAKHYKELEAAVNVVNKACRICVDVQKTLFSDDGNVLEKIDNTPVTIADFSVQALISLELGKLFPSIPLVAEKDSAFLRSKNLSNVVANVVNDNTSSSYNQLTDDEVMQAIDRGGSNAVAFNEKPATYWVGLALIVEGEVVLGVMGCPKWLEDLQSGSTSNTQENKSESGIIMAAHVGCGTWKMKISGMRDNLMGVNSFGKNALSMNVPPFKTRVSVLLRVKRGTLYQFRNLFLRQVGQIMSGMAKFFFSKHVVEVLANIWRWLHAELLFSLCEQG